MQRFLIDTQVLIWLLNNDNKLNRTVKKLLLDTTNEVNLSYFSIFEMIIKSAIGKLDFDQIIIDNLEKVGIEVLWPEKSSLFGYKIHNSHNKDPFDNAIITTAINNKLILVTADSNILETRAKGLSVLDANK